MKNVIAFNKKRPPAVPSPKALNNSITTLLKSPQLITQPIEYFLLNNEIKFIESKPAPKHRKLRTLQLTRTQIASIIRTDAFRKAA